MGLDCLPFLSLHIQWLRSISISVSFSRKSSFKVSVTKVSISSFHFPSHHAAKYSFCMSITLACQWLYLNHQFFIHLSCLFFQLIDFLLFLSVISLQLVKIFIVKFYRFSKVSKLAFIFNLVILCHLIHFPNFFYFSVNICHTIVIYTAFSHVFRFLTITRVIAQISFLWWRIEKFWYIH